MGGETQSAQLRMDGPPLNFFAKAISENGAVQWALGSQNPPAPGKAPIHLARDEPGRQIVIHLVPTQGLDIRFDRADPIWAGEAGQCPPSAPKIDSDQLEVVNCTDHKLTLFDKNTRACTITYQLNFVGAEPFDPEIRNGGMTVE